MYDGLTPLFDNVTDGDLNTYFKSEALGSLGTDGPGTVEDDPARPGVTVTRDALQRPAHRGRRRPRTASGPPAGSSPRTAASCSSRPATTAARPRSTCRASAPSAWSRSLQNFEPSAADRGDGRQAGEGARERRPGGPGGPRDIDTYIEGINAYLDGARLRHEPLDAQRHLRAQRAQEPVPRPGRRRRGAPLAVPRRPPGAARRRGGQSVFNDLRQFKNPERRPRRRQVPLRQDPEEAQGQRRPRPRHLRDGLRRPTPQVAERYAVSASSRPRTR